MITLLILLGSFVVFLLLGKFTPLKLFTLTYSANAAMAIMLFFTGISHFFLTEGMMMTLPSFVPLKEFVIYFTGILEIFAAIGLLLPSVRFSTSWALLIFFLMILPANFKAAYHHVDLVHATYSGPGPVYLWFRVPLQLLFMWWVYQFGIRSSSPRAQLNP